MARSKSKKTDGTAKQEKYVVGIVCCGKIVAVVSPKLKWKKAKKHRGWLKFNTASPVILAASDPSVARLEEEMKGGQS